MRVMNSEAPAASSSHGVVVIGGGWAGLAAAVELAHHGLAPIVLEASRQLGGRARAVRFGVHRLDNGQHLLFGACRSVLTVLERLGIAESKVFKRVPFDLQLRGVQGSDVRLRIPALPAPLNVLWGLLGMRGLGLPARLATLQFLEKIRRRRFEVTPDVPLAKYLRRTGQGEEAIRALWRPLCQLALNTPIERASTRLFLHVLRDVFFGRRRDSDVLLPIVDLGACLPEPATDFIEQRGGSVQLAARAHTLHVQQGRVRGVGVRDKVLPARHVIVAASPEACAELLRGHAPLATIVEGLDKIETHPLCTAYLRYPPEVGLGRPFIGVLDATVQWLFDHGQLSGRRGLLAAVIGGPGAHMRLSNEALAELIVREIARLFPTWPQPLAAKLVREKRATLSAVPGVDALRPGPFTAIEGLWLAGDYTATGYPSSLEGAVKSGLLVAQRILKQVRSLS